MVCSQGLISGWKPSLDDLDIDAFPASSSSSSHHASSSTLAPLPHHAQKGDPDYIKRPRNSFIIFRCDYVRDHSGTALTGSDKYKRLSKRAADAWRKLPRAKKAEYVQLSAKEKEEHARLYPDYIYRPNKRRSGRAPAARLEHRPLKLSSRSVRRAQVASLLERHSSVMSAASDLESFTPLAIDTSFHAPTTADWSASDGRRASVSSVGSAYHASCSPPSSGSSPLPAWDAPSPSVAESDTPGTPSTDFVPAHPPLTPSLDHKALQDVYDVYLSPVDGQTSYMPPYGLMLGTDASIDSIQHPLFTLTSPAIAPSANSSFSTLADWAGDMSHKPTSSNAYVSPHDSQQSGMVPGFGAAVLDTFAFDPSYMVHDSTDVYLNLFNPAPPTDFATQGVYSPPDLYGQGAVGVGAFGDFTVM